MTKQEIFKAAHKIAKETRNNFASYKAAFAAALKQVFAEKSFRMIPFACKGIKKTSGHHLTATNKKHLVMGLNQGLASFSSKKIHYAVKHIGGNDFSLVITQNEKSELYNKMVSRSKKYTFQAV